MSIDRRFLRFLVAGGVNTGFGYIAYGALVLSGIVPQIAVIGSTMAGICFNFLTTGMVF